jgi:hypothetical protein
MLHAQLDYATSTAEWMAEQKPKQSFDEQQIQLHFVSIHAYTRITARKYAEDS